MTSTEQKYERYMRHAIELAQKGWGTTHPNPIVGAVIVEDDEIVAEGWHRVAGQDHAEVDAIKNLGRPPKPGAEIYVTLEPCSTCGRTGACTTAIMKAGIDVVVVGASDPNPAHAGKGLDILREGGVHVVDGVLAEECADLNLIFNHWITKQAPLIAAKMAITLDGKFAAASGHSQWVTGELARADVMRWRRYFPAIAVGANTVLRDDPSLTSRIEDEVWCPIRFVLDRSLDTVESAKSLKVFTDEYSERTILVCSESGLEANKKKVESLGVKVWTLPEVDGHLDWAAWRERCAKEAIYGIYVEVGPSLATGVIEDQLADYLFIYQAPKLMSDAGSPGLGSLRNSQSMDEVFSLRGIRSEAFGEDRLTRGFIGS